MNQIAKAWQYDQHITDNAIHTRAYSYTHVAGTITILPNTSITKLCHILYIAAEETGDTVRGGLATLAPSESAALCTDGADILTLNCTADGALTLTHAGSDTYSVKLWILGI